MRAQSRGRAGDRSARAAGRALLDRAASLPAALLPALALLVLLALCAAVPAGAVIVRASDGQSFSYLPAPAAVARANAKGHGAGDAERAGKPGKQPLTYHGGPVMHSNTNYVIYWDPSGAPSYPPGYEAGINRYFEDVAHDSGLLTNTDSILAQYGEPGAPFAAYESHFGGAIPDGDPYPANGCSAAPKCLLDSQLRAEIQSVVEGHKLPVDLEHAYFLLTPEGVESCTEAKEDECSAGTPPPHRSYCAYHDYFLLGGAPLIYANIPYMEGTGCDIGGEHPNNNPSDATIAGGLAHEHSETVTDPELKAWFDVKGYEVADKCRLENAKKEYGEPLGKAPDGADYNEVINGDLYLYQQMWSNSAGGCRQRVAELPTVTKLAPKSGAASGGTSVAITGTGFTSTATVRFGEASATKVTFNSSTSLTAVSPAGVAKEKVYVTVTTSTGTSATSSKSLYTYKK